MPTISSVSQCQHCPGSRDLWNSLWKTGKNKRPFLNWDCVFPLASMTQNIFRVSYFLFQALHRRNHGLYVIWSLRFGGSVFGCFPKCHELTWLMLLLEILITLKYPGVPVYHLSTCFVVGLGNIRRIIWDVIETSSNVWFLKNYYYKRCSAINPSQNTPHTLNNCKLLQKVIRMMR